MNHEQSLTHHHSHRLELQIEADVMRQLVHWSASSGRAVNDLAVQLLQASVRVMGDQWSWPPDPPMGPAARDN